MWHWVQKPSSSEPGRVVVAVPVPVSKVLAQPPPAKGLTTARSVPSGGAGASQLPAVEVCREASRKAARQPGSRQELDIMEPFHSLKIFAWQVAHLPGLCVPSQASSNGGGKWRASATS